MASNEPVQLENYQKISDISSEKYVTIVQSKENQEDKNYLQLISNTQYESKDDELAFLLKITEISKHPGLLHIINYSLHDYSDNPNPTIFADFMEKGSLHDIIESSSGIPKSFTPTKKYINLLGISKAMYHLYFNLIWHGDLKLSTIFLDDDFYPHVCGYELTQNSSPILDYEKTIEKQSNDVTSFFLLAYSLITGTKCTKEREEEEVEPDMTKIRSEKLQNFIQNGLTKNNYDETVFSQIFNELLEYRDEFESELGTIDENEVTKYLETIKNYNLDYIKKTSEKVDDTSTFSELMSGKINYFGYEESEINKEKASECFKKAADEGDVYAMGYYAIMLEEGDGVDMNKEKAAEYYMKAADRGDTVSMFKYGLMLYEGDGVEKDKAKSAEYFKKAADAGDSGAMFNYGLMLSLGDGVPENKEEAAEYYKKAADKGRVEAMFNYACMLSRGDGIYKDKEEAAEYYKKAADKGLIEAMTRYGSMVERGDGVEINMNEVARYYNMAADLVDTP